MDILVLGGFVLVLVLFSTVCLGLLPWFLNDLIYFPGFSMIDSLHLMFISLVSLLKSCVCSVNDLFLSS